MPREIYTPNPDAVLAQPIRTKMDVNGNNRYGWMVSLPDGTLVGFVTRNQIPNGITEIFDNAIILYEVTVNPAQYRKICSEYKTIIHY